MDLLNMPKLKGRNETKKREVASFMLDFLFHGN